MLRNDKLRQERPPTRAVSPCRVWKMSQNSARIPGKEAELQKMLNEVSADIIVAEHSSDELWNGTGR